MDLPLADSSADSALARAWSPATGWSNGPADGWSLPAVANLHSHAFQRAMAGLAERQGDPADSFWTWREQMYRFAGRMDPESLRVVATQLYIEMVEAGYSSVCEFHYLHHAPDGTPYADPAAMSLALIDAARAAGIRLTLLPVLYMTGGFDGRALSARQQRFGHEVDGYLALFDRLHALQDDTLRVGCAFHSLRAVPAEAMRLVYAGLPVDAPIHVHIAEQVAEVRECADLRGARPVEWLMQNLPVDARWTLVHATHVTPAEIRGMAVRKATVALCPTTEANLGDGFFPLRSYLDEGGAWGIGSDSNSSVSVVEELRWLEYGQRLVAQRRNVVAATGDSVGETLLRGALASAASSTGFSAAELARDRVVLAGEAPTMAGARPDDAIDRWLFSGNRPIVRDVHVAGKQVVTGGLHADADRSRVAYSRVLRALLAD